MGILNFFRKENKEEVLRYNINNQEKDINENYYKSEIEKLVLDGVIGFAIGDALGVPVEFLSRSKLKEINVRDMLEYGTHYQPIGTWSDDTSTMIAVMDSISKTNEINYDDMMQKFCAWYNDAEYTASDKVFDIGIATSESITNFLKGTKATECGPNGFRQNGNGSLMRMFPIAVYCLYNNLSEDEEVELINNYSSMTHGHEISKLGCKIYSDYIKGLVNTKSKEEAYLNLIGKDYSKYYSKETIDVYNRVLKGEIPKLKEDEISSSGFVVHSLEASIWCTLNSSSYEEAVLKAVNLGDDTDTVGAITGSINGVIYGLNSIRKEWKLNLKKINYLYNLCSEFSNSLDEKKNKIR